MAKTRKELTFAEKMLKLSKCGLLRDEKLILSNADIENETPEERAKRIKIFMEIMANTSKIPPTNTLAFIMYDIENNRIRRYIAKYLKSQGYIRVQKSVFFGNISRVVHKAVCDSLKEVNEMYENGDSILCLPVSLDMLNSLKLIGNNVDLELTVENKNTLFF